MKKKWICLLSVAIIGITSFISTEVFLRHKVSERYSKDPDLHRILFYSNSIKKVPRQHIAFRLYENDATLIAKADITLNNYGYFSKFDYSTKKEPNEFRILTIGGEQTASSVADISWPDVLQENLQNAYPEHKWSVVNIAWPDAGFTHYANYWKEVGQEFQPDLVIVNFVETDFARTADGVVAKYKGQPVSHYKNIPFHLSKDPYDIVYINTPAIGDTSSSNSIANPNVIPTRPWGLIVQEYLVDDLQRIKVLQANLVKDYIKGGLPKFGALTWRKLTNKDFSIKRFDLHNTRSFDPHPLQKQVKSAEESTEMKKAVYDAIQYMGLINHPKVIFTQNINYGELSSNSTFPLTTMLRESQDKFDIVVMRDQLPILTSSEDEVRSWYLYPFMSEKWSVKGHQVYAETMAKVLIEKGLLPLESKKKSENV